MLYLLEHLAVIFGAVTGALAARGKGIDWFGVVVLGLVACVGGGTLRDVVLDVPVFWVQDHSFLISGVIAALLTISISRFVDPSSKLFLITDAFFLAFVATLGTHKTHALNHASTICALLGVVTGVAGGMVRDIMLGEIPLVFRPHIYLYATAALIGSIAYLIAEEQFPDRSVNLLIGSAVTLSLRLAAIRWRIQLPVFDFPLETEQSRD